MRIHVCTVINKTDLPKQIKKRKLTVFEIELGLKLSVDLFSAGKPWSKLFLVGENKDRG